MTFKFKKPLSVLLAVLMVISAVCFSVSAAQTTDSSAGAKDYGLSPTIRDGAILHAWCWNFKTIKEQLPQIAQAGFTSVQTSPINQCKVGNGGKLQLENCWWYHYQSTLYTIGNYQLGTLDEFRDLCEEAHKYGIKIIVDVVANHCSSDYSAISSEIKNIPNAFHPRVEISNWSKRYQVTQGKLSGLYDLNTANPDIQSMIKDYLNDCLEAGADGFRYDAAKHIELPDEPVEDGNDFKSDFWTNILDNDAEFQYGEILQGNNSDKIAEYSQLLSVTASKYGENLRSGLSSHKMYSKYINNYAATGVDPTHLVTWVESHDNYCNDGSYSQINDDEVRIGWAIIAAKGDTTPLFFARPKNSSAENMWGDNKLGPAGNGNYYHPEVAAVNHFRNAMVGESYTASGIDRNYAHVYIQRGNKGAVIVNFTDEDFDVNTDSKLPDGEYTDEVYNRTYTVANGKITGTVKANTIAVIYDRGIDYGMIGDVNGDNNVDSLDAVLVQKYASQKATFDERQLYVADVNDDGYVDILDATEIQKYAVEKIREFKKKAA